MDGLISNVASTVLTSLGSSALQEVAAAWHFKSDLDDLKSTITFVRNVLVAHEAHRQPHDLDPLIERLKDAVHDADDLIDKFTTLAERGLTMTGGFTESFQLFFSSENQVSSAVGISTEITRIRNTLDKIVEDRDRFASMFPSNKPSSANIDRETYSVVDVENVIGRDDDKQKILDDLLRHDHHGNPESHTVVLGIYGIGGLGKTTIAQLVFNDEFVQGHFELKIWACIGDFMENEFGEKFVIKKILSAMDSSYSNIETQTLEQLHRNLREKMEGKKYLLVLDDLWEENPVKLRDLKKLLPFGETGSAVLVTTRSECTAEKIGTIRPMKLQCLSDDASWTLFQKITGLEQRNDQRLEQIGKEIVKKCANVPLAITVVGCYLRGENETEWRRFKDSDLANIDAAPDIMPLLKLSYYRLLPHLKQCFTYCSLFPKDCLMDPIELYYLWIAQGFITRSVYRGLTLEEAAEKCLRKLEERCFIQCNYLNGAISTFKMHDLMHDLAKEVAGEEIYIADDSGDQNHLHRGVRHLSLRKVSSVQNLISSMQGQNHLRTLLNPLFLAGSDVMNDIINSFQCVRALELGNIGIELPESIGKLIHLRYLKLDGNRFEVLPKSITRLYNLETLNLDWCRELKELPWDLSKLVNLQNLGVDHCEKLACMPARMDGLTRLQRLNRFVVGEGQTASTDHAYTGCCNSKSHIFNASGLSDLIPLTNLRGSLEIDISSKVRSDSMAIRTKATAGCLLNKSKLTDLTICFHSSGGADASRDEGLLECLQPHCDITGIKLIDYRGTKFPSWMLMDNLAIALPNLVAISLLNCSGCECLNLPILSRLRYLKTAVLFRLPRLEYIESPSYEASASKSVEFFPSLQELTLWGLSNVKGWWMPTGDGTDLECDQHVAHPSLPPFFPRLKILHISHCPNMTSMPLCPYLKELRLWNFNENLHIIPEKEEYSILAASLGPSATSTSTSISSSSSSAPNYCPSTHLVIDSIGYLNHLPKQYLQSLTELVIYECKDVALSAAHDEEEDQMACKSVERLPKGLEYLINLKTLKFSACDNLVELPGWISQLSSLESLEIHLCQKLKSLPDGIRDLTSLRRFVLIACGGDLIRRCEKLTGEDWHKIQHVPKIIIF